MKNLLFWVAFLCLLPQALYVRRNSPRFASAGGPVEGSVNDITGLTTIRKWRRNLALLLSELQAHSPNAVIAVAGMPPLHAFPLLPQPLRAVFGMRARIFDKVAIKVINGYRNAIHVPLDFEPDPEKFAPDGYHPSEESYVEFGRYMADGLLKKHGLPAFPYKLGSIPSEVKSS